MMSFWKELLGIEAPPLEPAALAAAIEAAVAAAPAAPSLAQKRDAAAHAERFARAAEACRAAIEHGESTVERLAELERWQSYYAQLAALEAGEF